MSVSSTTSITANEQTVSPEAIERVISANQASRQGHNVTSREFLKLVDGETQINAENLPEIAELLELDEAQLAAIVGDIDALGGVIDGEISTMDLFNQLDINNDGRINREDVDLALDAMEQHQGTAVGSTSGTGGSGDIAADVDALIQKASVETDGNETLSKQDLRDFIRDNERSDDAEIQRLVGMANQLNDNFNDIRGRDGKIDASEATDFLTIGKVTDVDEGANDDRGDSGTPIEGVGEVYDLRGSERVSFTADQDLTLVVAVNASHGQDSRSHKIPDITGLGENFSAGNNDIGITVASVTLSAGESIDFTVDTNGGKGAYMIDLIDGHYEVSSDKAKKDGSWGLSADKQGDLYGYFGAYDDGATRSSARDAERDGFTMSNGGDVLIWKIGRDSRMDPDLISNEGKGSGGNKGQLMLSFDEV